ncbi:metal-sensitive transcriptional regulator [Streptomyces lonarensis]|uniref:metal-sensitive transcriptional regulator n=1 Tax=Streptomyces lonarensis TaxID=700599 RepID=UPI001FD86AB8|nr:metal-sensitive transcriptional regulator [Streptomyces lonarensis]
MTIARETPADDPGPAAPAAPPVPGDDGHPPLPAAARPAECGGEHGKDGTEDREHGAPHTGHGYSKNKDAHLKRLRRIEGQVRGLHRMVEEDIYCIDILTQVSASTKALQSFALQLLEEHLRHCVAQAAREGGPEADAKVAEATAAIARLLRT